MYNVKFAILLLIFAMGSANAQSYLCFDNAEGEFWPINIGKKIRYSSRGESYTSYFNGDSLKVDNNYFLKEVKEYSGGIIETSFWREEDGVIYYYDDEKKAVSIELINNLTPGTTWEKYDKTWKYTIIDTVSIFSTPYCEFKNLLQVKAEPQNEMKDKMYSYYNLFYKRGIGMIGMSVNGKVFKYAIPNKELNERNFIVYGCENFSSNEDQQKCTYARISEFFRAEFKAPKRRNYKTGKMMLKVIIGKDGTVEDIIIVESIEGAELQEKEAIRVMKMLPKMIPAQVDDGKPIRSSFQFPIKF